MKKLFYTLFITGLILSSCIADDFLSEAPSKNKNVEIKYTSDLEMLIYGFSTPNYTSALSTDLTEYPVSHFDAASSVCYWSDLMYYLWTTDELINYKSAYPWTDMYNAIFKANMIIGNIYKVSGDQDTKDYLNYEAHFIRAMANWEILNTYCLPYSEENMNEPGTPKKESTSFTEDYSRMTLKKSYEFVESDLKEALKMTKAFGSDIWKANLPAVEAFAARFYLYQNNYSEALKYANLALAAHSSLINYNTEMMLDPLSSSYGNIDMPYMWKNATNELIYTWKEYYYYSNLYYGNIWYRPSKFMLDKYDKANDLRYEYLVVEKMAWRQSVKNLDCPGYVYFQGGIPTCTTVPEVLLTKAECQARLGQWQEAMNTIKPLREARMRTDTPALTATSQNDAILKIIDERIRELTYTTRWFDIRRYNNNETTIDDVTMTRTFYSYTSTGIDKTSTPKEYTLGGKSRRFAVPIMGTEIIMSDGKLIQNTY